MDYNAAFEPTKLTLGNGVVGTMGYNARLQLASLAYTSEMTCSPKSAQSEALAGDHSS